MNKFIKFIADNWELQTEYAGRIEIYCFYCKKWQDPQKPSKHTKSCLHVKAKELIKKYE